MGEAKKESKKMQGSHIPEHSQCLGYFYIFFLGNNKGAFYFMIFQVVSNNNNLMVNKSEQRLHVIS